MYMAPAFQEKRLDRERTLNKIILILILILKKKRILFNTICRALVSATHRGRWRSLRGKDVELKRVELSLHDIRQLAYK